MPFAGIYDVAQKKGGPARARPSDNAGDRVEAVQKAASSSAISGAAPAMMVMNSVFTCGSSLAM